MKKLFIAIFLIIFLSAVPVFACCGLQNIDINNNYNKAYGGNAVIEKDAIKITNKQQQGQIQGQAQKQQQGQIQGQKQTANNEGVKQKVVFEAAEILRDYLAPGEVKYAKLGTYKESKEHGPEFTPFAELTKYKKNWSYEHALRHYGKPFGKGKCITIGGSYNGRHEAEPSKEVTVIDTVDMNTMEPIGFLTIKTNPKWKKKWFVKAADKEVSSFTIVQKAILSACIMQGNYIKLIREGAETISWNSGVGVGGNVSGGIVNDMDNRGRSGSTSGGTGWSYGEAGNRTLPWGVFQVFKKK